ncbi:MAG: CNNM domain-containing protein [Bdellovibrionota bacterium]
MAKVGNKDATKLLMLRTHPERTLSIIQLGLTFTSAIAAAVGGVGIVGEIEPYISQHFGISQTLAKVIGIIVLVTPLTYLSVVIGELVPKTLALRHPTRIVMCGVPRSYSGRIEALSPICICPGMVDEKILDLFFHRERVPPLPEMSIEIGELSPVHQKFMLNMATIEKRKSKISSCPGIMSTSFRKRIRSRKLLMVVASAHTRLPVLENNRVIGILHTKEFNALKESGAISWQSIIRQMMKVQSTDSALGVLRLMQEKRNHMMVVFSPFGERLGIVTLEDILEEVIGDIFDEDDDGIVRRVFAARSRNRLMMSK